MNTDKTPKNSGMKRTEDQIHFKTDSEKIQWKESYIIFTLHLLT